MKLMLLPLLLPLFLISCIEVRDAHKEDKVPPVSVETPPLVEVRGLAKPHHYVVNIRSDQNISQITRKSVGLLNQMPEAQVAASGREAEDLVNQPGHYEYIVQQNGRVYQIPVEIPEDYVVEGNMQINQLSLNVKNDRDKFSVLETSGRLFFKAGSSLTTNGENFLIKVGLIESEGAMMQTFPLNRKAQMGIPGRHGGHLKIEARELRGTLHAIMRGEDGGSGESSTFHIKKPVNQLNNNGQNGGNSGFLDVSIEDKSKGAITFELFPGNGGEGVEIHVFCLGDHCDRRPYKPKGQDGLKGVAQQPIGAN